MPWRIIERAVPRPVTPVYSQLSEILQISLHRALTRQQEPREALQDAAAAMRALLATSASSRRRAMTRSRRRRRHRPVAPRRGAPGVGAGAAGARRRSALVALFPIVWTLWESLHLHDLRMPWLGRPFVGAAELRRSAGGRRGSGARSRHTVVFVAVTRDARARRPGWCWRWRWTACLAAAGWCARPSCCRGRFRRWSSALVWRFMFESPVRPRQRACSAGSASTPPTWFADAVAAWVPLVLADVWKTTPFVALLLLAGLQNIDRSLYEAADVDGAGPWRQFTDDHAAAAAAGAAGGAACSARSTPSASSTSST